MTTILVQTRADWGAVPPTSTVPLNWGNVTKFIVHYSGATRSQTVRSIQRFCMDDKGHSDIDYNELVRGNVLYIGRGDNVGSHTLGNNSTSYGICMIGLDGDATDDDMNVIRTRYDWACQRAGRTLQMLGHNQAPGLPPGYTSCPGGELQAWINEGMPFLEAFMSEWTEPLTQGNPGYAGHQRDTALAFAWENAEKARTAAEAALAMLNEGTPVTLTPEQLAALAAQVAAIVPAEAELRVLIREEIAKTKLS